jgi:uncharacterized protein (TIGR03437 family)
MGKLIWCCALAVAAGIPADAGSGIVYTCDSTVNAKAPQACGVLNTTIAALYSEAFTNANASVYVELGNTTLAHSNSWYNLFTYSDLRTRLMASSAGSNDAAAIAGSVPATSPFGNSMIQVPTALQRALGLSSPTTGVTPNGGSCNQLGSPGCYDGVIVVSSVQPLYFRIGPIAGNQYDFYTLVEHETDEILGSSSCAFGCGGYFDAADLFRYHSNGTRSSLQGTNAPCSSPNATNACFSLDGVHMLQQYNNIENGLDAGDWLTNCQAQMVQDADSCAGTTGVDIDIDAEILVLDVVGYTLQPLPVPSGPFHCTNTTPPAIASVTSASAYGGYPYFAGGTWMEIKGTNLADPSDPRLSAAVNPGQWTATDFNGANAPTVLDGVRVSIDGKPAYVWYLSPGQLNVQAPADSVTGAVAITVTNCLAQSPAYPLPRQAAAPGLLAPPNYQANGTPYMVATFASDGAYVLNTSTGAAFGLNSRPAKPGDLIVAYGVGFGDVTPAILPGVIVGQSNTLTDPVAFSFGTTAASSSYSGLAANFVGLYEFYITVPPNLANGDYPINVTQNGAALPQKMYLTVHN